MSNKTPNKIQDGKPPKKVTRQRDPRQLRRYDTRSSRNSPGDPERSVKTAALNNTSCQADDFPASVSDSGTSSRTDDVPVPANRNESNDSQVPELKEYVPEQPGTSGLNNIAVAALPAREEESDAEDSSGGEMYNFLASEEDAPTDECLYKDHFDTPINETAEQYLQNREINQARRQRLELFMYAMAAVNQSDVHENTDLLQTLETELSARRVENLTLLPSQNSLTVQYRQRRTVQPDDGTDATIARQVSIPISELIPQDEIVVVNGIPLPSIRPNTEERTYNIPHGYPAVTNEEQCGYPTVDEATNACRLCSNDDVSQQLQIAHPDVSLRHAILHRAPLNTRMMHRHVDVFSTNVTLEESSYGREYNFLPTADSLEGALNLIMDDDTPQPTSRIDQNTLLNNVISIIRDSYVEDLILYYSFLMLADYRIKGRRIRHVYYCEVG